MSICMLNYFVFVDGVRKCMYINLIAYCMRDTSLLVICFALGPGADREHNGPIGPCI